MGTLSRTCLFSKRISLVLAAHGWNGSGFGDGGTPNFRQLLSDLQAAKVDLEQQAITEPTDEVARLSEPAKQGVASGDDDDDAEIDEYEDEFIDASADSLNVSRTLKAHNAAAD